MHLHDDILKFNQTHQNCQTLGTFTHENRNKASRGNELSLYQKVESFELQQSIFNAKQTALSEKLDSLINEQGRLFVESNANLKARFESTLSLLEQLQLGFDDKL